MSILADCMSALDMELWAECWNEAGRTGTHLFIVGAIAQIGYFGRKILRGLRHPERYQ